MTAMRDETSNHQHHGDDNDLESRPHTKDDRNHLVKTEAAVVAVEETSRVHHLTRILARNTKNTTKTQKKFAHVMGIMMVCVLVVVMGLVIGLRGANTNSRAESEASMSVSAAQQEMAGDAQVQTAAEIEPETKFPLSGTSPETNMPLSGTLETSTPLLQLSLSPSARPTSSSAPSLNPSKISSASPTSSPSTEAPTSAPFLPLAYGEELTWTYAADLGIEVSSGISVKVIAQTGRSVMYSDGTESSHRYHSQMDGAGIVTFPNGGYVYVSNSELEDSDGGRLFTVHSFSRKEFDAIQYCLLPYLRKVFMDCILTRTVRLKNTSLSSLERASEFHYVNCLFISGIMLY